MVNQASALQRLWEDTCSIYTKEKTTNETTKRTEFAEKLLHENQPCKLSFETLASTSEMNNAPSLRQGVKLFISNTLSIPAGSKIVVTRNGVQYTYKNSGEPGVFTHHQEISLELFEGWA